MAGVQAKARVILVISGGDEFALAEPIARKLALFLARDVQRLAA